MARSVVGSPEDGARGGLWTDPKKSGWALAEHGRHVVDLARAQIWALAILVRFSGPEELDGCYLGRAGRDGRGGKGRRSDEKENEAMEPG